MKDTAITGNLTIDNVLEELSQWHDDQALLHAQYPSGKPHSNVEAGVVNGVKKTEGDLEYYQAGQDELLKKLDEIDQKFKELSKTESDATKSLLKEHGLVVDFQPTLFHSIAKKPANFDTRFRFLGGKDLWGEEKVKLECYLLSEIQAQIFAYGRADFLPKSQEAKSLDWIRTQISPLKTSKNKWWPKAKIADSWEMAESEIEESTGAMVADHSIDVFGHRDGRLKHQDYMGPYRHFYLLGFHSSSVFTFTLPTIMETPDKSDPINNDGRRMLCETLVFFQSKLPPEPLPNEIMSNLNFEARKRNEEVSFQAILEERRKQTHSYSADKLVDILSKHFLAHAKVKPDNPDADLLSQEGLDETSKKHLVHRLRKIALDTRSASLNINWHLFSGVGMAPGDGEEFSFGTWFNDVICELRSNQHLREQFWDQKFCLGFVDSFAIRERMREEEGPVLTVKIGDNSRHFGLLITYKEKNSVEIQEIVCLSAPQIFDVLKKEEFAGALVLLRGWLGSGGNKEVAELRTLHTVPEIIPTEPVKSPTWKGRVGNMLSAVPSLKLRKSKSLDEKKPGPVGTECVKEAEKLMEKLKTLSCLEDEDADIKGKLHELKGRLSEIMISIEVALTNHQEKKLAEKENGIAVSEEGDQHENKEEPSIQFKPLEEADEAAEEALSNEGEKTADDNVDKLNDSEKTDGHLPSVTEEPDEVKDEAENHEKEKPNADQPSTEEASNTNEEMTNTVEEERSPTPVYDEVISPSSRTRHFPSFE